jgi:hypothetical protein
MKRALEDVLDPVEARQLLNSINFRRHPHQDRRSHVLAGTPPVQKTERVENAVAKSEPRVNPFRETLLSSQ